MRKFLKSTLRTWRGYNISCQQWFEEIFIINRRDLGIWSCELGHIGDFPGKEEKESILIRKNSLGMSGMCMGDSEVFIVCETLEMVGAELVRWACCGQAMGHCGLSVPEHLVALRWSETRTGFSVQGANNSSNIRGHTRGWAVLNWDGGGENNWGTGQNQEVFSR